MRIAIVRKKYVFHGGSEGFSQSLIRSLSAAGNEVHVYALEWDGPSNDRVSIHSVPALRWNSFLRDLTFALSARRLLRRERFDIIQSHDKTLLQDIYRAGDGCHIEWLRQRWKRIGWAGRMSILFNPYHWLILGIERSIFRRHRYRKIIAISELVRRNIGEHYGVRPNDIVVIYNGVDLHRFHPSNRERFRDAVRMRHGIGEHEMVLLFVGSGFERKGVEFLLRAADLVDFPLVVLVVGRGRAEGYQRPDRRQRVVFAGPRKDVEEYYAAADIFVFPSIYEPFGNVHLEALASGLPVITSRCSGGAEVIRNGENGYVVDEPEDCEEIAQAIRKCRDGSVRDAMGTEARRTAERFSEDVFVQNIMRLYGAVVQEKAAAEAGSAGAMR